MDDVDKITESSNKIFMHNRTKIARYWSEGIALLIKDNFLPFIQVHISNNQSKLILWFEISKQILFKNKNLVCGVIYIPPHASKYAHSDPYIELQKEVDKICGTSKHVLFMGDFNSRTASMCDYRKCDEFISEMHGNDALYAENIQLFQILEENKVSLHKISIKTQMHMATKISSFEVLEFDSQFSDAHYPLIMKFDIRNIASKQKVEKQHCNNPEVRLWND